MSSQFFPKLSQNYIELLNDDEYYDVTIEAGEDPNVNIFRAHMNILCYRSPYLRRALASNKKNNDNTLAHIKLSNISPEILKIILKYIYGGILSLDEQETSDILKVLIAADELLLQEIVEYLQNYLIENKSEWIEQHFELHQLYEDLLNSYLDPNYEPKDNISFPRNIKVDGIIDSKIVNLSIVSTISRWIDKVEINDKFSQLRELYVPYKFKLLLRASKDGFNPGTFHTLCDDKAYTVTFVKIKGTEEILGGYNPSTFISSDSWGKTKDSFIFSFKNTYSFKGSIISKVNDMDCAINNHHEHGPGFGNDLILDAAKESVTGINTIICKKEYYEKKISDTKEEFAIEDYEVFQIIKRKK
ncbi:BTB/POZ protein [Rhizophagus irregularis DAOM 181602=DAOM 197198]|nr:BTB/POZ protein [Rhizophagus irregularis DAOM 181602=DAOM 197198]